MEHYLNLEPEKVSCLQRLVDELMKEKPREDLVKRDMENLGLPYTADPLERINMVLSALHPTEQ